MPCLLLCCFVLRIHFTPAFQNKDLNTWAFIQFCCELKQQWKRGYHKYNYSKLLASSPKYFSYCWWTEKVLLFQMPLFRDKFYDQLLILSVSNLKPLGPWMLIITRVRKVWLASRSSTPIAICCCFCHPIAPFRCMTSCVLEKAMLLPSYRIISLQSRPLLLNSILIN